MKTAQRGFTLIEMMVVLAIIAVIAIALASVSTSRAATPLVYSERVTGLIQLARLRAEARRTTHRIVISTTEITISESTASGFAAYSAPPVGEVIENLPVPVGVVVWSAVAGVATSPATPAQSTGLPFTLDIRPDGQSPTGGTFYFTDDNTTSKARVFVYKTTGTAMSRDVW